MDLNDHPPGQHSLEIIHIEELDEENTYDQKEEIIEEPVEAHVEDMVEANVQQTEQCIDESVDDMVQQTEQCIDDSVEAPIEEMVEAVVKPKIEEVEPEDSAINHNTEEIRYDTPDDVQAPKQD